MKCLKFLFVLILTWRAFSYAPPEYTGKILPTKDSLVTVALEAIDEGGRAINLGQKDIRWYVDTQFIRGGRGLKNVSFRTSPVSSRAPVVRVNLDNQDKFLTIPLAEPEVTASRLFGNGYLLGETGLIAQPYFFNTENFQNLDWQWKKEGGLLKIFVQNPKNRLEFAKQNFSHESTNSTTP